jgi:hypothetical protein
VIVIFKRCSIFIEKGVPELSKFCKEILTEEHEFVPYNPDLQENSEIHDCGR